MPFAPVAVLLVMVALACVFVAFYVLRRWL
jgi:hypothetical protein